MNIFANNLLPKQKKKIWFILFIKNIYGKKKGSNLLIEIKFLIIYLKIKF